jgi:ethanolamine utilization protein EutN
MIFGRVRGQAISTLKYPDIKGSRLLIVEPLNRKMESTGPLQVAVDTVEANQDDLCVMVRSREASLALPEHKFVPVDLAIVGLIDQLDIRPDGEYDFILKEGHTQYS